MTHPLLARLQAPGPKRILALDGGGIRGCASLGFLEKIEAEVRTRLHPGAVLSDYFDLIGGTSTGAIIAALLALGKPVAEVRDAYLELGPKVFSRPTFWARIPFIGRKLFTNWSEAPLEEHAKKLFSEDTVLGSPHIKTGLCVVTKRADTFSTWPYINHPQARFFPDNADIPLWKLIRASTAAPTYFRPVKIEIGKPDEEQFGVFIDGGVSMANNPALQLFLVATLKGFAFHWQTGDDQLLVVSIGTGRFKRSLDMQEILSSETIYWAQNVPELLMLDASNHNELMLQYLSSSATARSLGWELGNLEGDLLGGRPLLTYLRYNSILDAKELDEVGQPATKSQLASLRDMAAGTNATRLYEIGRAFAERQFSPAHLPAAFNPAPPHSLPRSA